MLSVIDEEARRRVEAGSFSGRIALGSITARER